MVKEKGTTPINPKNFDTDPAVTDFLQQNNVTANVLDAMPSSSVVNQQNPRPSKIPSILPKDINNIPTDDGF